jgi:protocatechuate 3,4-dioxygenase beta subunit
MSLIADDHDLGLQHDLLTMAARLRARRQVLGMMLGGGTALLAGCGGGSDSASASSSSSSSSSSASSSSSSASSSSSSASSSSSSVTTASCTRYSSETNGPYPSDGTNTVNGGVSNVLVQSGVVRSDIRGSFGSSSTVAPGVPLTLTITLANSNNLCSVLPGAAIYIWHCTRDGLYSLYSSGVTGENYLRGVQVADANGQVTFTTIFPGCYSGRYPHIHLEVFRTLALATGSGATANNSSLISQLAMPLAACQTVYAGATGYSASVANLAGAPLASDNVFSDNTAAQITAETPVLTGSIAAGYTGSVTVGVPLS